MMPVDPLEVLEVGELDRRPCPAWPPSGPRTRVSRWSTAAPRARAGPAGRGRVARLGRAPARRLGVGAGPPRAGPAPPPRPRGPTGPRRRPARPASPGRPGRGVPSSARAWPAVSWPSATSAGSPAGSWNRRRVLATADAALAHPRAPPPPG